MTISLLFLIIDYHIPQHLSIGFENFSLEVLDASKGNPFWASGVPILFNVGEAIPLNFLLSIRFLFSCP